MPKSEFDAIIVNFEDTGFTAYYKKGLNLKLSDKITVINIFKPGTLKASGYDNLYYEDAIIQMSGNDKNIFTYQDMKKVQRAIEKGIDYLNMENENLIDREKICSYKTIKKDPPEKRKTSAIKYADLEIGGIYKDNKDKEWIFLGESGLYKNNTHNNREGKKYSYIYMQNIELEKKENNWFYNKSLTCKIDSYSSKKRFFEKVGQLDINSDKSITFFDDYNFYAVYGPTVTDKEQNEAKITQKILYKNQVKEEQKKLFKQKQSEILKKLISTTEKLNVSFNFINDDKVTIKFENDSEIEFIKDWNFYQELFYPLIKMLVTKNMDNIDSINFMSKKHDNTELLSDCVIDSDSVTFIIKNYETNNIDNIENSINNYILEQKPEKGRGAI